MKFSLDHVDECSYVGYAVSNFDLLPKLYMREHSQISFKLYSFIVIIVCFYSCKIIIRTELFELRLALNPGLKLTQVSFSCVQKHFLV